MENQRGLEKMRFSENEKSELLFLIKSICSLEKKKENDLGDAELAAELRKLWRESYSEHLKNAIELLEDIAPEAREFALKELGLVPITEVQKWLMNPTVTSSKKNILGDPEEDNTDNLSISKKSVINEKNYGEQIKKASLNVRSSLVVRTAGQDFLLGDFNNDNKVDLLDFVVS